MQHVTDPAVIAALIAALGAWLLARWTRREDRENEYRKALSRGVIREAGWYACCSNLVFAIDQLEDPPVTVLRLREQALEAMEDARRRSHGGGSR